MSNLEIYFWLVGITLYFNIGELYNQYMITHDSSHSWFRRLLGGGWNLYGERFKKREEEPITLKVTRKLFWIFPLYVVTITWFVWLGWKVLYFIFGGIARELNKDKTK